MLDKETDESLDLDHGDEESALTRRDLVQRAAVVGGAAAIAASGLRSADALAASLAPKPKRGGTFRWATVGGSTSDYIDGQSESDWLSFGRLMLGWDTLLEAPQWGPIRNALASEVASNKQGTVWTIRIKRGIEFHNGKTLTADDVRYSLQRAANAKLGTVGGAPLRGSIDPKQIRKVDQYTVRCSLLRQDALFPLALASKFMGIVPAGYSATAIGGASVSDQIGTGAYKLESFTAGGQSVHVRNPNYWRGNGQPYFDRVVVVPIADGNARVNALLGGQVDAVTDVPPSQVAVVQKSSAARMLFSKGGGPVILTMNCKQPPFNDVRVRQAVRLLADRPQLIRQALNGYGTVGNDLLAPPFDPAYNDKLPQRKQDIERAKSLLKAAGRSDLTFDLPTAEWIGGQNQASQIFAQQAKAAGVTINVKVVDPNTWYSKWLSWPITDSLWAAKPYAFHVDLTLLPTSPYNETAWPDAANQRYVSLAAAARKTLDEKKRNEIWFEMQRLEWTNGGNINWTYNTLLNGVSRKVQGFVGRTYRGWAPLEDFGSGFRTQWFA